MRIGVEESRNIDHARKDVLELLGDLVAINLVLGEVAEVVDASAFDDCCVGDRVSVRG